MRVQFRRATGQVQRLQVRCIQYRQHLINCVAIHLLRALRSGVNMAVHTTKVTQVAQIDLQRLQGGTLHRGKITF